MGAASHDLGRDAAQAALNEAAVSGRSRLWGMRMSQRLYLGAEMISRPALWPIEARDVRLDRDAHASQEVQTSGCAAVDTKRLVTAATCKGVNKGRDPTIQRVMNCRACAVDEKDHIGGEDRAGSR